MSSTRQECTSICVTYLLDIRAGDAFSVTSVGLNVPQHSTLTLKLIKVSMIPCTLKIEFLKHNINNNHVHKTGQTAPETVCESLAFCTLFIMNMTLYCSDKDWSNTYWVLLGFTVLTWSLNSARQQHIFKTTWFLPKEWESIQLCSDTGMADYLL